jgi:DNA-binding FrmR family transcriptional regulator
MGVSAHAVTGVYDARLHHPGERGTARPGSRKQRDGNGEIVVLQPDEMKAVILRMKRAHGHLGSVIKMLEEGAECEAVLTQLAAVNKALSRAGYAIVSTGLQHCLTDGDGPEDVDAAKMEKLFLMLA